MHRTGSKFFSTLSVILRILSICISPPVCRNVSPYKGFAKYHFSLMCCIQLGQSILDSRVAPDVELKSVIRVPFQCESYAPVASGPLCVLVPVSSRVQHDATKALAYSRRRPPSELITSEQLLFVVCSPVNYNNNVVAGCW